MMTTEGNCTARISPPVFIVSTGRAGSNMLARVLARHQQLLALHEPRPHLSAEALATWCGSLPRPRILNSIRAKRDGLIEQTGRNGFIYVESAHYCSHLVPELHELYGARFIHLHRDGRSFVRSGLERRWWFPENRSHSRFKEHVKTWLRRRYLVDVGFEWNDHRWAPPEHLKGRLEKVTWLWVEINRAILKGLQRVPTSAVLTLRLEAFDAAALGRVFAFADVVASDDLIAEAMRQARAQPNKTEEWSVPEFYAWSSQEQADFWAIAGPMMQRLGYGAPDLSFT